MRGLAGRLRPRRLRATVTHAPHWWQFARFLNVGASGFAINLAVYSALLAAGLDYRLCGVASNITALSSNFLLHRAWTFSSRPPEARRQAIRFSVVSTAGVALNLLILSLLAEGADMPKLPAEALASAFVAPINFVGNRQWTFR